MPGLLDIRLQVLLKNNDRLEIVGTANAYAQLSDKDDKLCYRAARAEIMIASVETAIKNLAFVGWLDRSVERAFDSGGRIDQSSETKW